jgi:hypothetical protein
VAHGGTDTAAEEGEAAAPFKGYTPFFTLSICTVDGSNLQLPKIILTLGIIVILQNVSALTTTPTNGMYPKFSGRYSYLSYM